MRKTLICTATLAVCSFPALAAPPPCPPGQQGSAGCPVYVAPATTAVPDQPVDGSTTVPANVSTLLSGGIRPPNGFMVRVNGENNGILCFVNNNGPTVGFLDQLRRSERLSMSEGGAFPSTFITPPGYKPMGPVSVFCTGGYIFARAW